LAAPTHAPLSDRFACVDEDDAAGVSPYAEIGRTVAGMDEAGGKQPAQGFGFY
jgi:hypothetical protein